MAVLWALQMVDIGRYTFQLKVRSMLMSMQRESSITLHLSLGQDQQSTNIDNMKLESQEKFYYHFYEL